MVGSLDHMQALASKDFIPLVNYLQNMPFFLYRVLKSVNNAVLPNVSIRGEKWWLNLNRSCVILHTGPPRCILQWKLARA